MWCFTAVSRLMLTAFQCCDVTAKHGFLTCVNSDTFGATEISLVVACINCVMSLKWRPVLSSTPSTECLAREAENNWVSLMIPSRTRQSSVQGSRVGTATAEKTLGEIITGKKPRPGKHPPGSRLILYGNSSSCRTKTSSLLAASAPHPVTLRILLCHHESALFWLYNWLISRTLDPLSQSESSILN